MPYVFGSLCVIELQLCHVISTNKYARKSSSWLFSTSLHAPLACPSHSDNRPTMKLVSVLSAALIGSSAAFAPAPINVQQRSSALAPMNMAAEGELYIDQERRNLMNLILVGSAAVTVGGLGVPYILFFLPPGAGGGGGGVPAKDALGNEINAKEYLASKKAGDHSLAQGLKGDATYLIVKDDSTLEDYGLNAVCTHLGCVVPWSAANNKFMCPCHGSQVSKYFYI